MPYQEHRDQAGQRSVTCAVITCSDTRTPDNDVSGKLIQRLLTDHGHDVAHYEITKDEPAAIRSLMKQLTRRAEIQSIILNGGTGIARRDNTFDVIRSLLDKELPGFGEIFRALSFQSIGSGAILSRATAGLISTVSPYSPVLGEQGKDHHVIVFSIPGSPNAVELAMTQLILPELSHLVWETLR